MLTLGIGTLGRKKDWKTQEPEDGEEEEHCGISYLTSACQPFFFFFFFLFFFFCEEEEALAPSPTDVMESFLFHKCAVKTFPVVRLFRFLVVHHSKNMP
jgi:hypothetical protein